MNSINSKTNSIDNIMKSLEDKIYKLISQNKINLLKYHTRPKIN